MAGWSRPGQVHVTRSLWLWRRAWPASAVYNGTNAIALPDEEGSGLIANVLPLEWRDGRNPLASLPGVAAVIIQNPVDFRRAPMEAFAGLYGLSSAERKVLEHIADGKPPQETADHLGISVNTVKTHLQKIFAKNQTPDGRRTLFTS